MTCSVTGSVFCKCVVKGGSTLIIRVEGPSWYVGNGFPLHGSLEEPVVAGRSHQRHRGGGAHYYSGSHPVSRALFFRLMTSHVQSATKKKQVLAAKMSSFAKRNAARWFSLGWVQTPFTPRILAVSIRTKERA